LEPGEVALYTDEGDKIHLKRNNEIEILTTTLKVTCQEADILAESMAVIDSPLVDILSDEVNIGDGALEKVLKGETFQARFNSHTHIGNAGVATSPPQVPSPASDLSTIVSEA
jgi:phage gp45-like